MGTCILQLNSLKREQREVMISLLKKQLEEQLELTTKQQDPVGALLFKVHMANFRLCNVYKQTFANSNTNQELQDSLIALTKIRPWTESLSHKKRPGKTKELKNRNLKMLGKMLCDVITTNVNNIYTALNLAQSKNINLVPLNHTKSRLPDGFVSHVNIQLANVHVSTNFKFTRCGLFWCNVCQNAVVFPHFQTSYLFLLYILWIDLRDTVNLKLSECDHFSAVRRTRKSNGCLACRTD